MSNTILLKGDGVFKEATAGGAITPGMFLIRNSSNQVVVHATAAGNIFPLIALEEEDFGAEISDAYGSGDRVRMVVPQPGSEIYALVAAAAAAIVVGDLLESDGAGMLRKYTAPAAAAGNVRGIVARALEAVDNSAGGSAARIKVEIL